MRYLLYNPFSGEENFSYNSAVSYSETTDLPTDLIDITKLESFRAFYENLEANDDMVIFGGDGSLNKVANQLFDLSLKNNMYYYPCGTGNDFARDVGVTDGSELIYINDYIKKLPVVTINGVESKFINGVGFGIDGYCCEVGDKLKSQHKKPNYTAIAISGLLFHFKPVNATVTIDGQKTTFKKVWIAPTMFGRYYGGGMMPTPNQNRDDESVSLMVFHGSSKLKTLMIFPSIFKGEHIKNKKYVTVLKGSDVTVEFDRPTALQIDGETMLNVSAYNVKSR